MAGMVFRTCLKVDGGLDDKVKAKMWSNIIIDVVIGLVPFLGDFADIFFRANSKNAILLEEFLRKKGEKNMIAMNSGTHRPMTDQSGGHHVLDSQPAPHNDMRYANSNERHHHDSDHRHESHSEDRHQVRNNTTTGPSRKTTKEKSSGGGWLGRLNTKSNNAAPDLESGMAMPTQPPRARV